MFGSQKERDLLRMNRQRICTYLRPRTLIVTMGIKALHVAMSSSNEIWNSPATLVMARRMTAMESWTKRKNTGMSVFMSTHLLL